MTKLVNIVYCLIVLAIVNTYIWQKEDLLRNGQTVFFELRPVDPRSIMQGDYMDLAYKSPAHIEKEAGYVSSLRGKFVIELNEKKVAKIKQLYTSNYQLKANEALVEYRFQYSRLLIGSDSFFFQEGHGKKYENAKYGEFKLAKNGEAVLTGLRDQNLARIKVTN